MTDINLDNCYDVICKIDSILSLPDEQEVACAEPDLKRYEKGKGEASCKVAVIGNANKGKSYTLKKLT